MKLQKQYYLNDDVVYLAKDLLGKVLCFDNGTEVIKGMITETEAYAGATDKASHAYDNKRTARTEVMFKSGGHAYIYLIYGMYNLFNVVTNVEGIPHAVLVRAVYPLSGIDSMKANLGTDKINYKRTNGPGKLGKAYGFNRLMSGESLLDDRIWIEDVGYRMSNEQIVIGPRIGVDYAEEDALLPYRFLVEEKQIQNIIR